jgi:hypothetical protein
VADLLAAQILVPTHPSDRVSIMAVQHDGDLHTRTIGCPATVWTRRTSSALFYPLRRLEDLHFHRLAPQRPLQLPDPALGLGARSIQDVQELSGWQGRQVLEGLNQKANLDGIERVLLEGQKVELRVVN